MEQNLLNQKPPIYNEKGQVIDPEIARIGAEIELKAHKKTLGIFKPSEEKIWNGEINAELAMENGDEIDIEDAPDVVQEEIKKYEKKLNEYMGNQKYKDSYNFDVHMFVKSDIGDGVTRYTLTGEIDKEAFLEILTQCAEFYIKIDVKDGVIVNSTVEPDFD